MVAGEISLIKRTVIVPKNESLGVTTIIDTTDKANMKSELVFRNASNGFYTYDVMITGKEIGATGITNIKFMIVNIENNTDPITGLGIASIPAADTLLDIDTVRTDAINNVLTTHMLVVFHTP